MGKKKPGQSSHPDLAKQKYNEFMANNYNTHIIYVHPSTG